MSGKPDPILGMHAQALALWQRRAEVIANNLANADTPGYQARDIDFRKALQGAGADGQLQLATDQPGQIASSGGPAAKPPLEYRVPMQPSMDGNTVDTQIEQSAFAQNTVHYMASMSFISARIQGLRMAITGSSH